VKPIAPCAWCAMLAAMPAASPTRALAHAISNRGAPRSAAANA
jgi:hypothetical protein